MVERSITAIARPFRQTGMVSCLTGTPRRHSGSPSRQIRPSATAVASSGCSRPARTVPTMSFGSAVGPVVGRTWASAIHESSSGSGAHSVRSANDRSASSSQSDTSECSHSRSAGPICARRARSFRVGTLPSSHRISAPLAAAAPPGNVAAMTQDGQAVAHGGAQAVAAARAHGARTIFTLSGGHVFPVYDGAVKADPPMPILDVRHEQTAVFAAEATARLTRTPGFAVLTAGPGVTNGISAITTAYFNGSSVVVLGGRAPDYRWGSGSLQEFDHPALLAPITKRAWTEHSSAAVGRSVGEAFELAAARHRGPVFLDVSLEALFGSPEPGQADQPGEPARPARPASGGHAGRTRRQRTMAGSRQHRADRRAAGRGGPAGARARLRCLARRGRARPPGWPPRSCSSRWSRTARAGASCRLATSCSSPGPGRWPSARPTWSSWSGHRWTSGSATASTAAKTAPAPAEVVHVADAPGQLARHRPLAASAAGDLTAFFTGLTSQAQRAGLTPAVDEGLAAQAGGGVPVSGGRRRRVCWPATPSRSTRCGSTASWRRCSRPTRS